MLNQCNFIGRLGRDPEIKFTEGGKAVCSISIACSEKYKGEERTVWVSVIFWEKLAEIASQYLRKGSLIFVSGRLQTRSWEDKDGNKKFTTEIVCKDMKMLGGKRENGSRSEAGGNAHDAPTGAEDDVPF